MMTASQIRSANIHELAGSPAKTNGLVALDCIDALSAAGSHRSAVTITPFDVVPDTKIGFGSPRNGFAVTQFPRPATRAGLAIRDSMPGAAYVCLSLAIVVSGTPAKLLAN